ncbi:MAG: glycosyltransferase family 39 protein [Lewinellaceae bacterium]|nr:glycosyltransferase family 39 protein [Lewinellaceae bacterium]
MKHSNKRQAPAAKTKQPAAKTAPAAAPSGDSFPLRQILVYGALAAVLLFVFFVRFRLLSLPLERDEGEYALMGQLILQGIPPYEMAYNMKLPGTYYAYAFLMLLFGQTATGVHAGLLVVNLASIVLLFAVGKRLVNDTVGVLAAASFALLSLSPGSLGLSAHATHFNVLTGLAGFLLLLRYFERRTLLRLAASGFCFGLSFVMKQHAVLLMLFGMAALALFELKQTPRNLKSSARNMTLFGGALVLPYLLVVLVAVLTGSFDRFWHWTVEYAGQYASIKTWSDIVTSFDANFVFLSRGMLLFWYTGVAGLAVLFFSDAARKYAWTILLFVLFSLLCVLPGFYFRQHYFIVFFPALALLVGVALHFLQELVVKKRLAFLGVLPFAFFGFMFFSGVRTFREHFFKDSPERLCTRMFGSANPFPESLEIGRFIRANSTAKDKIAVIGSEPQIYFYSDRLPATGYIYTYPLMENQVYSLAMQQDMIAEVERNKPKFLVYVNSPFSWLRKEQSYNNIFDWYAVHKNQYKLVGMVEISPGKRSVYAWREALATHTERGETRVSIYERE